MENKKPHFEDINEALKIIQVLTTAPQEHGLLCALFSFGTEITFEAWADSLITKSFEESDVVVNSALQTIKKLYDFTKYQFNDKKFDFDLILPDSKESSSYRIEALIYWIKGFLSGIELLGLDYEITNNKKIKQAVCNLMQISSRCHKKLRDNDVCKINFIELIEHIRMAVLVVDREKN